MVHNDVACSYKSNCIDSGTKILTVSSNRSATSKTNVLVDENFGELFSDEDYEHSLQIAQYVDDAQNHSIAYMASVIEAKIMKSRGSKKNN